MRAARHEFDVSELDGLVVQRSRTPLGTGDNNGDVFAVALRDENGAYATLLGVTVTGEVIRADGQTVYLAGSVSGTYATVTLTAACYAVPGDLELTIKLSVGSMTRSVLRVKLDVIACTTEILATYSEGGGSIANLTGAIRYDTAQDLNDDQKAQARANIGVTSTGADISGIIDDDLTSTESSSEKVWSSRKSQSLKDTVEIGFETVVGNIGDKSKLTTTTQADLVSAINEVNAKVGSGTGGGTWAAIDDTTTSQNTTWSSSKITQAINDAAAGETLPTDGLRIECWGDSLTFGAGAAGDDYSYSGAYPAVLATFTGSAVYNYGVGGENCETILARMGATPMYVSDITIPASGAVVIAKDKLRSATGAIVAPLKQVASQDKGVNNVTIGGVEGTLSYYPIGDEGSDWEYYFVRTKAGNALTITSPVEVVTSYMQTESDNRVRIIWMGQNDITDEDMSTDPALLAQYIVEANRAAIRDVNKYIILTSPISSGSSAKPYRALHRAMVHAFGEHCINIVDYLIRHGLDDAIASGDVEYATDTDAANIEAYFIPASLRSDLVHLNAAGYAVVADQVYKRGQLLGYWT